jgi:anti-repressor protein
MNDLIPINYNSENPTVSGRELHQFLEVKTAYTDWFPRMCEYGFEEGKDRCSFLSDGDGFGKAATRTDRRITVDMAKKNFV